MPDNSSKTQHTDKSTDNFTQLYRHYGASRKLLYVGISLSTVLRLGQHRKRSGWYRKIVTIDIENYPTREDALKAESLAIHTENPRYNTNRPEIPQSDINARIAEINEARIKEEHPGKSMPRVIWEPFSRQIREMQTDQMMSEQYQRYLWTNTLNDADYLIDQEKWCG